MLIARLDQVVGFVNACSCRPRSSPSSSPFFDTVPASATAGRHAIRARFAGESRSRMSASPTTAAATRSTDLSFSARAGETIALVGATGSGKSTTLGLLHRIFDPRAGAIRIDGLDIRD